MGGVRTNHAGENPTLKDCFPRRGGLLGRAPLQPAGGNSVAETVAAAVIVSEFIADFCERKKIEEYSHEIWSQETLRRSQPSSTL